MNATGTITMTMREVDRFKVIQAVTEARLKPGQAAERLGLGVRQVERLVRRYERLAWPDWSRASVAVRATTSFLLARHSGRWR